MSLTHFLHRWFIDLEISLLGKWNYTITLQRDDIGMLSRFVLICSYYVEDPRRHLLEPSNLNLKNKVFNAALLKKSVSYIKQSTCHICLSGKANTETGTGFLQLPGDMNSVYVVYGLKPHIYVFLESV